MAETIKIGGELESTATGNKVADVANIKDKTKGNKSQAQINAELETALEDRYTKSETYSKSELNNMITTPNQEYETYNATDQTTDVTDVLPATGEADTVYRVGNWDGSQFDASVYSEYAWNGSQYVHLSTKTKIGEVFDISAYHATGGTLATYADLSAALDSNNGGGVPQSLQEGGMSVKFVRTYDNKYVQYICFSDEFTTDATKWAICYSGVYINNKKYVYALLDGLDRVLWAVEKNGNIYYGAGVPQQIIDYIAEKIAELQLDKVEDIVTFLGDLLEGDKTLLQLFDEKVDKEEGKGLIDNNIIDTLSYTENSRYISIEKDAEDKFLSGRKQDGTKEENCPVEVMGNRFETKDAIHIEEKLDYNEKGISHRKEDGTLVENAGIETPHIETENIKGFNGDFINLYVEELWQGYKPQMESLNRSMIPAYNAGKFPMSTYKPLVLSVITDTHNYNESIKRFLDFNIKYAGYIDASLHIGDICLSNWTTYQEFVEDYDGYNKIMISIGNHDVYNYNNEAIESGHSYSDRDYWATDAQKFARYMKYIKNWGVHYTEDKCYYYKDFLYANIRLIVLDCMGWDASQKTWFTNTLADAKTKSLHVIVAEHIPVVNSIINPQNSKKLLNYSGFDCTFESMEIITMAYNEVQCNPDAAVVVQHFIDGTDEFANIQGNAVFVTWLFGHWHTDSVGVLTDYPNQMYIVQGGDAAGQAAFEDTQRTSETILQDLYNVIGVDYITKTLTVLRIGANIDRHLRKKEVLVVSYEKDNIKVVNNY